MKKARNAILLVFLSFICIVTGFFIGRYSARDHYFISSTYPGTEFKAAGVIQDSHEHTDQSGRININTASVQQLQMLPDIGEVLAARIVAYRTEFGAFTSVDDLIFVDGIGEKRLEELRQFITIGG